jgi:membrane glycosyltransferase
MLVAPILMAFHSTFVVTTLLGRRVQWTPQQRGENGQNFLAAVAAHWKQTIVGLLSAAAVWIFAAAMLVWLIPVFAGLILAIPLSIMLSSVPLGRGLARRGLLLIPQETHLPNVLRRHRHFLALPPAKESLDSRGMFRQVLTDPALLALHRSILEATETCVTAGPSAIGRAQRQLLAGGAPRVSTENRRAILSDPAALDALHLFVWTTRVTPLTAVENAVRGRPTRQANCPITFSIFPRSISAVNGLMTYSLTPALMTSTTRDFSASVVIMMIGTFAPLARIA